MHRNVRLLALSLLLPACSSSGGMPAEPPVDLAAAQQRWSAGAPASYRFDYQQECFCVREQVQPVTIEVRDGRVARVVSRESGQEVAATGNLRWPTIVELFDIIAEAQRNGVQPLVVQYHEQQGYPTRIEAGSLAADAGVIYHATNLQPLAQ